MIYHLNARDDSDDV